MNKQLMIRIFLLSFFVTLGLSFTRKKDDQSSLSDRQYEIIASKNLDKTKKYPVLFLFHGYTSSGQDIKSYVNYKLLLEQKKLIIVIPEGTKQSKHLNGNQPQFWNATKWCCDFGKAKPNDTGFFNNLLNNVIKNYPVDKSRVYLFGHSNGGFMANRIACDYSKRITAIASLAGGNFKDPKKCRPTTPVSVLQIHGTKDDVVTYNGTAKYPGAESTISGWANRNQCKSKMMSSKSFDTDDNVPGRETSQNLWTECQNNSKVELWTLKNSKHVPKFNDAAIRRIFDWLFSIEKTN